MEIDHTFAGGIEPFQRHMIEHIIRLHVGTAVIERAGHIPFGGIAEIQIAVRIGTGAADHKITDRQGKRFLTDFKVSAHLHGGTVGLGDVQHDLVGTAVDGETVGQDESGAVVGAVGGLEDVDDIVSVRSDCDRTGR